MCYVNADISSAPYTSHFTAAAGATGYSRGYDVILLVGLTELKAQVCWIDSETVRTHLVRSTLTQQSHPISTCANLGDREKVCGNTFRVPPPWAESNFKERRCGCLRRLLVERLGVLLHDYLRMLSATEISLPSIISMYLYLYIGQWSAVRNGMV